jgi:hypothetical protein
VGAEESLIDRYVGIFGERHHVVDRILDRDLRNTLISIQHGENSYDCVPYGPALFEVPL